MTITKRHVAYLLAFVIFASAVILLTQTAQNALIGIGELLIRRKFNHPEYWYRRFNGYSMKLIFFSFSILFILLYTNSNINKWYSLNVSRNNYFISIILAIITLSLFILPYIIFGENSVITIHDNLDDSICRFKFLKDKDLFFKLDSKLKVLDNISTLYFNREGFTLLNFVFCKIDTYCAYVLMLLISSVTAFFSMFYMLKTVFKIDNIILNTLISMCYAICPSCVVYWMSVATLPLIVTIFYQVLKSNIKYWYIMAFLYPFLSELSSVGVFVCPFYLLGVLIVSIREKKLNKSLVLSFILLVLGTFISNYKLIYMRMIVHEELNRDYFLIPPSPFFLSFKNFLFYGHYHSASMQSKIINLVLFSPLFILVINKMLNKKENIIRENKFFINYCVCFLILFLGALLASFSDAKILDKIINVVFPFLKGLSLSRIFIINKLFIYVLFALSIKYIYQFKKIRGFTYVIGAMQILYVFVTPAYYNDSFNSWKYNFNYDVKSKITYRNFYSEKQFQSIKEKINYTGEYCCALGLDPAVLLYNSFNSIGGYLSVYPYEDMRHWHNLMAPEFERNEIKRSYFDEWGGRRYLYNKDIDDGNIDNVNLYIDMEILKNDFECKFILSNVIIQNSKDLKLELIHISNEDNFFYKIYVYEII